jgi:hypothetical protein
MRFIAQYPAMCRGRQSDEAARNITCYTSVDGCEETRSRKPNEAREAADEQAMHHLPDMLRENIATCTKTQSFRSRSNAHASLKQHSFDRASRYIDTRFDRLASSDLHRLMNKVLYEGRNAIRKQDFS